MLNTPVLFIVFNRPETTKIVFDRIKEIKPKKLYIISDGPRENNFEDLNKCKQVKEIVNDIDWQCDVKRNYSDSNLGFSKRIKSGLQWFFEQEEYGIILEDDCLPDLSFFKFCEILLQKHKDNMTIDMIIGSTFCDKPINKMLDYLYSDFSFIWGWATWARAFRNINWESKYNIEEINNKLQVKFQNTDYVNYFLEIIRDNYNIKDSWDVEFFVEHIMTNKTSIISSVNLVANIGNIGTHYYKPSHQLLNVKTHTIDFNKFNSNNGNKITEDEINYVTSQYVKKANYLSLRDKFYLFRKKYFGFIKI